MSLIALLLAIWIGVVAWRRRQVGEQHWKPLAWLAGGGLALAAVLFLIDFEAQKLATRLATPLGLAWLTLWALALAELRSRQWTRAAIVSGAWLALTLGGNAWIGGWLLASLEAQVPPAPAQVRADAIVVLGGGTWLNDSGEPQLGESGDRLRVGALLWRNGAAPLLVTTGSGVLRGEDRNLAAETATIWRGWGVPETGILEVPGPANTSQELTAIATIARERGWQRIALVSSAWHLPRAIRLAQQHGLDVIAVPADSRGRLPPPSIIFLPPCGSGFRDVQLWTAEVLGRLVGR